MAEFGNKSCSVYTEISMNAASLSAQSWQYRDRGKSESGSMPYSYRMTSRFDHSAPFHRQHCTLQTF